MKPQLSRALRWLFVTLFAVGAMRTQAAEPAAATHVPTEVEERLYEIVKFLAADEREGRGVGTAGLDASAEYVAARFSELGLKTSLYDGTPFQEFSMTTSAEMGEPNLLSWNLTPQGATPSEVAWQVGGDFTPLAIGGSAKIDMPVVFAGYGISARDEAYDDYAGIDVKGKAVIVLRHEPQQDNPHSAFAGTDDSPLAALSRKFSNAFEHEAGLVIFVTDEHELKKRVAECEQDLARTHEELATLHRTFKALAAPSDDERKAHAAEVDRLLDEMLTRRDAVEAERDPLFEFRRAGTTGGAARIPAIHCRRAALDAILKTSLGTNLATLEAQIDHGPAPASRELPGVRLVGEVTVMQRRAQVKNVLAVLEGQGPHAEETVVIGAHYDHLGRGGAESRSPTSNEIHNGADDNASGTAGLIEIARILSRREQPLGRRVVFAAFTGEESGLIGSQQYCKEPLFPLDQTVAMLNMDMIGRMQDHKLIVYGFDTATEFGPLLERINEQHKFQITRQSGGTGPSDHASFYLQKVPVLHFFTGTHSDYHLASDDLEKLNLPDMQQVTDFVADVAVELANADKRPEYQEVASSMAMRGGDRPYFGSIPDFSQDKPGYALSGVSAGGPAGKAGLKAGDIIIRLGESKIGNLEDFDSALRKHKAGEKVSVVVQRDGSEQTFEVTLERPRS